MAAETSPTAPLLRPADERLDSWKEIAAYLKRDERTLRRWEKLERLPVHRHVHEKRPTVYAYKPELDAWWNNRRLKLEALEASEAAATVRRRSAVWMVAAVAIPILIFAAWLLTRSREVQVPPAPHVIQVTAAPGLEDSPTWSPDGRSIAYVSDAAGNLDIYVQQLATGQTTRLTDSEADDAQPAWSPDGGRIAFVSARNHPEKHLAPVVGFSGLRTLFALRNGDLWVMSARGGRASRLAQDAYYPAWSPDGKRIAYAAFRNGQWGLWIQEVDSPNPPLRLALGQTPDPLMQPAWSPDDKWIAFVVGRGPGPGLHAQIFAVASHGGQARPLTGGDSDAMTPSWSPDGRWLYFSSDHDGRAILYKAQFLDGRLGTPLQLTTGSNESLQPRPDPSGTRIAYGSSGNAEDIWEYDLKSRKTDRITHETSHENNPRPSPDGAWLAFASNRRGAGNLWLLNRRTQAITQVSTSNEGLPISHSRWSRDGKYLYYLRSDNTVWQYALDTDTSRKVGLAGNICLSSDDKYLIVAQQEKIVRTELTSGRQETLGRAPSGNVADLTTSTDGRWYAFHLTRGEDRDIWVMPSAGGAPRQLTSGENEDSHPAWSADSRSIYFVRNHEDVYVVPLAGGEPRPVTDYNSFSITLDYPAVTADGRYLLFARNDKIGDIYILEYPPD